MFTHGKRWQLHLFKPKDTQQTCKRWSFLNLCFILLAQLTFLRYLSCLYSLVFSLEDDWVSRFCFCTRHDAASEDPKGLIHLHLCSLSSGEKTWKTSPPLLCCGRAQANWQSQFCEMIYVGWTILWRHINRGCWFGKRLDRESYWYTRHNLNLT